ncbi:MAG: TetR/AcrR family transcriptional regulator [Bacteroidetes bacterium]|nr:TetR/AcrR family transcriptional regulator [Bacteroidota bacterium]
MRTRDADKEQLVKQKAIELLVADGFEGFSINKLAKACGISVATLYIYYKDKDDLIISIAIEESKRMSEATLKNFDPDMSFEAGLRNQWKNRYKYMMDNPQSMLLFEQLRSSTYHDKVFSSITHDFKEVMEKFMKNAVARGEVMKMPLEAYWSVAYAPLYSLMRFHNQGSSIGGKAFAISDKLVWQTFELVLKALRT